MVAKYYIGPHERMGQYLEDIHEVAEYFSKWYGLDGELKMAAFGYLGGGTQFELSPYQFDEKGRTETAEKRKIRIALQAMNMALGNEDNQYKQRLVDQTEHIYECTKDNLLPFEKDAMMIVDFLNDQIEQFISEGYIQRDEISDEDTPDLRHFFMSDEFKERTRQLNEEDDWDDVIPWEEAYQYVGETITVEGPVVSVPDNPGERRTFIDIGETWPNKNRISCLIWEEDLPEFNDMEEYDGKVVHVSGKIEEYNGVVQIVLRSRDQLEIQE